MTQSAENDAPKCGHTATPCTDARTWCPDCDTPPCCHHIATCRQARFDDHLSVIPPRSGCGASDHHQTMRDREHLAVCPICKMDLAYAFPPGEV